MAPGIDEREYTVTLEDRTFRTIISATAQAQAKPSPEQRIKVWVEHNPLPEDGMTIHIPDYHFDAHYF